MPFLGRPFNKKFGKDMNVLISGGAGYLGSRVAGHFLELGMHVAVLDCLHFGGEGMQLFKDHPKFQFFHADIRDEQKVEEACRGMDGVVHLAALVGEEACRVNEAASHAINFEAVGKIFNIAKTSGVGSFIFTSTCSNYGVSDPEIFATEETPLEPLSLYAETKVSAENFCLEQSGDKMAATVLRLGTLCGLSGRMRFNLLVNEMARSVALGESVSIFKPKTWRPFLHIQDAARVMEVILRSPVSKVRGQVFNVVGENFQKQQLVDLVFKHFPDANIDMADDRPDHRDYRVSARKIESTLGFFPEKTVEKAFLEIHEAIRSGMFIDPHRKIYEALPPKELL